MALSTAPSSTLIVRIPMRFQRRGGRKGIVTPDRQHCLLLRSQPRATGAMELYYGRMSCFWET
jgi:hypothetical protein